LEANVIVVAYSNMATEEALVAAALLCGWNLKIDYEIVHPGKASRIFRGTARKIENQIENEPIKVILKTTSNKILFLIIIGRQPQTFKDLTKLRREVRFISLIYDHSTML
jgi:hypothetical protein